VYRRFESHEQDYCAVKEGEQVVGLCSRGRVGFLMGHRYGFAIYSHHLVRDHLVEHPLMIQRGTPIREVLEGALGREGKEFNDDIVLIDEHGEYLGIITVPSLVRLQSALVAERFQAQETLHRRLLEVSHQAGMAEVATGVLHNVGNVLNSVNVSATLVSEMIRKSRITSVGKVSVLLNQHRANLGPYITTDVKGKLLPDLIQQLAEHLRNEQAAQLKEVESLRKHLEHIKNIVAMQQRYAKVSGLLEPVQMATLVEDALELNADAFARHGVKVVRQFAEVPRVMVDRHKILQILINLLRNGKYALDQGNGPEKLLTINIGSASLQQVRIQVKDNGIGIPPENLNRIFAHGFTTKKDGHGFGLHSCALAAKEMGGSLLAQSDGVGKGATFTLELPIDQKRNQN
jgi:signal transduction histidine kinase